MPGPGDFEQLMLELINEARLNPMANAARYISSYDPLHSDDPDINAALSFFQVSGTALFNAYSALVPVAPLAWNDALGTAAEKHSAAMIAAGQQTHQAPGEASLGPRVAAEGYNFLHLSENVYAYTESPLQGHAGFMVDWGFGPDGMQSPAGHRTNIMNADYTEIGIDSTAHSTPGDDLGPFVVTQDLGDRGKHFVLGVAYSDMDEDAFYSMGEGRADLTVTVGGSSVTSGTSGGYALEANGAVTVTLSGGGLPGNVVVTGSVANDNLKLDVVDGDILRTSGSISVSGPVSTVWALAATDTHLTTGAGSQVLIGNIGDDVLDGGAGTDFLFGGAGNDSYFVDEQGDLVFEGPGTGIDLVTSTSNFYLYADIENLTLANGAGDIFGVGNGLDNLILGNDGLNLIIGWDGADEIHGGGARDALFGVEGNDRLFGDAGIDYIVAGAGDDTVDGGADADEIYGQDGNDILTGGASFDTDIIVGGDGDDVIYGNSGLGDYDLLYGNLGDDSFYVDTPDDLVFEQPGEGHDTVYAGINGAGYYLYDNIEDLVLTGNTPFGVGNGLANVLTGSAQSNWLLGGAGDDILNGKGGNDVLFGEAGEDVFVFEPGTGGDVIGDFVPGTDRIDLSAFQYDWQTVLNSMHEAGGSTAIDLQQGDFIVLGGVAMADLGEASFILV